jgi:hypothetical protein
MLGISLSDITRYLGVAIAALGVLVVAPEGAKLLLQQGRLLPKQGAELGRRMLARLLPSRGRHIELSINDGISSSDASGTLVLSGTAWIPDAPVDERIELLREQIAQVNQRLQEVDQKGQEGREALEGKLAALERDLGNDLAAVRITQDERARSSAEADARALPVIALGVILTGIPDEMAGLPPALWAVMVGGAVLIGLTAAWSAVNRRRAALPGA